MSTLFSPSIIDVGSGELVLHVGDEKITLQARDFMRVTIIMWLNVLYMKSLMKTCWSRILFKVIEHVGQVKSEWCNSTN
ncbi:hypothetical protein EPI10_004403 [Gossypium australe]|uniref:Uncharacterized protein n=1 Tax=Gossypium australe TaxID=47621 RepID=A0A5B6WM58_9ROSI|nr:hypothetical protein EPI10_004403 [Gossypium australe]